MPLSFSRRGFFRTSFAAAAGAAVSGSTRLMAREPIAHPGPARLRLSLAAYSFRDYFIDSNHKRDHETDPSARIDMFRFVDYCAEQGCDGAELTSYYFPQLLDREYLLRLKRHAFLRGIEISGTAVGNTFTPSAGPKRAQEIQLVKTWIDHADTLGAPHIRVFAGSVQKQEKQEKAEAKKLCISALEECGEYALAKGIFLGLENHGGIVAEPGDLLDIVKAVNSPAVGINLDTGNFETEDPYADLAKCAPYAVNVQIKQEIHPKGKAQTKADLRRLTEILREAHYQGYVALEYESSEDPWKAVPRILGELRSLFRG